MNVDGACRGSPGSCGGGGVFRNDEGKLIAAFAVKVSYGTNNEAEFHALIHDLKICRELGLRMVPIECNSLLVVQWLEKCFCTMWYLWVIGRSLWKL